MVPRKSSVRSVIFLVRGSGFSGPSSQASKNDNQQYLHTDWVQLDTPGKATVEVVILKSNDGHEVCVVGDEAFVELSAFDPQAWDEVERKIENGKF